MYTCQQPQVACYVRLATIRYLELQPLTNVKAAKTLACNVPIIVKHLAVADLGIVKGEGK